MCSSVVKYIINIYVIVSVTVKLQTPYTLKATFLQNVYSGILLLDNFQVLRWMAPPRNELHSNNHIGLFF